MQSLDFYQMHLNRVSRSFAFCILKLDSPLRQWVSLSYLLCRAVDTIEDTPWNDFNARSLAFNEFENFIKVLPSQLELKQWSDRFSSQVSPGEKALLADAIYFFEDFHDLPKPVRLDITLSILCMSRGMQCYSTLRNQQDQFRLMNLTDVNRYCYFVAGTVGELLTHLVRHHRPDFKPQSDLMKNSVHFGLFLQKINILKDQRMDEKEGRYLVPNRDDLRNSLRENAIGALNYLIALPNDEVGYRTFCAWSLFLGLASLPWIEKDYTQGGDLKIPRSDTLILLSEIESIVQDDYAIRIRGDEYLRFLSSASIRSHSSVSQKEDDHSWFFRLSTGSLQTHELVELGFVKA
jgi:hypothetical protein